MIRMEAIWNRKQLERPPNASCRIESKKIDGNAFLTSLDKVINDLTAQELLHKEAAILSRLIYRMKIKFRNDKGVKSMSKINKSMLNYLSLSLEKEYENLKGYVEINEKFITLPSKQMVEYVLVKTQGFSKLMLRVEEVSKYAAHFLKCRIGLGHAWSMAVIAYAVVSRIWILSRYLVKRSCSWYKDLYNYLNLLKLSGLPWLPKDYELTRDLKSWILVPWIEEPTPSVPSSYGLKDTMFKLITQREYDSDEDAIENVDVNSKEKKCKAENESSSMENQSIVHKPLRNVGNHTTVSNDDAGEVIDRCTFNLKFAGNTPIAPKKECKNLTRTKEARKKAASSQSNKPIFNFENAANEIANIEKGKNVTAKRKKALSVDDAKNKSDLLKLLRKESYPGLDKLQWNMIRNKCKKLLGKLEANDTKQSIVFKKIMKRMKTWMT